MEEVEYWPYELIPLGALNARSKATPCVGALLRRNDGYGCLQPWPSLGDAPLQDHLNALANGMVTNLAERALNCCRIDGEARREGRSLFSSSVVPPSHTTIPWPSDHEGFAEQLESASRSGCSLLKVKAGPEVGLAIEKLRRVVALWTGDDPPAFRIDFNGTLDESAFLQFAHAAETERIRIDFVEDPIPYESAAWVSLHQKTGLALALDRQMESLDENPEMQSGFQVGIWKPAIQPCPKQNLNRLVVSSSMDHAVGQLFAAYEAATYPGELDVCGLLTHPLFEPDPFFDQLVVRGARLVPPKGPGLGFGKLLEDLPWRRLT